MTSDPPADSSGDISNSAHLTPVMRQYREIKDKYPDTILFFRIGDFYETFERDAELISRELDIVLTSRSKSGDNRIPLAGVPYHAADGYIAKLVGKGYKVAVVDQVGDTKNTNGIVKRELRAGIDSVAQEFGVIPQPLHLPLAVEAGEAGLAGQELLHGGLFEVAFLGDEPIQ